jgi:8-oxo-dGTP diphosphatase
MEADRSPLIVGAAIVRDGRLLSARRTGPPDLAGRWELPGGKVEAGEEPEAALVREVREELACVIRIVARVPGQWPLPADRIMRVWLAELVDGEPTADAAHDELRWLTAGELGSVPWLDADLPLLPVLRPYLVD